MKTQREGFSLVEILIVAVLGAIVLGAVFQTVVIQSRAGRQQNAIIATQQTNRTALQLLAGEMREMSSTAGDLLAASPDSIRFRAVRKLGFLCVVDSVANAMSVYRLGDQAFATGDSLLIFRDADSNTSTDDSWLVRGTGTVGAAAAACNGTWTGSTKQGFTGLAAGTLSGVTNGSPVRSFERVTYAFKQVAGEWSLARRGPLSTDTMVALVGPLSLPADSGLVFHYWDTLGVAIAPANLSTKLSQIGRIEVKVKSTTKGASTQYVDSSSIQINLRGN